MLIEEPNEVTAETRGGGGGGTGGHALDVGTAQKAAPATTPFLSMLRRLIWLSVVVKTGLGGLRSARRDTIYNRAGERQPISVRPAPALRAALVGGPPSGQGGGGTLGQC